MRARTRTGKPPVLSRRGLPKFPSLAQDGGHGRTSTCDLPIFSRTLQQLSYVAMKWGWRESNPPGLRRGIYSPARLHIGLHPLNTYKCPDSDSNRETAGFEPTRRTSYLIRAKTICDVNEQETQNAETPSGRRDRRGFRGEETSEVDLRHALRRCKKQRPQAGIPARGESEVGR